MRARRARRPTRLDRPSTSRIEIAQLFFIETEGQLRSTSATRLQTSFGRPMKGLREADQPQMARGRTDNIRAMTATWKWSRRFER